QAGVVALASHQHLAPPGVEGEALEEEDGRAAAPLNVEPGCPVALSSVRRGEGKGEEPLRREGGSPHPYPLPAADGGERANTRLGSIFRGDSSALSLSPRVGSHHPPRLDPDQSWASSEEASPASAPPPSGGGGKGKVHISLIL